MSDTEHDPRWLTAGLRITAAIVVFRLASGALEIINVLLQRIPYEFVRLLGCYSPIVTPAIAVAAAVLASGWPARKLNGARRKTKIAILAVLLVMAMLPLQLRIASEPVRCRSIEWIDAR